LILSANTLLCL